MDAGSDLSLVVGIRKGMNRFNSVTRTTIFNDIYLVFHNELSLSDDPALTMAFSVARRAAVVPHLLVKGTYRSTVRAYLDPSILQHQLQRCVHGSLKGTHLNARSMLEVPIYWFIHKDPLLVDKHYQAKALPDMIIVVQTETSSWERHLQCNGRSLLRDSRRPVKAAITATTEHLAGLLPLHLVYSQAHETAIEDWTWSVGCNPLSITSQGWHLSRFQSDVITALEESIQTVNAAIHCLFMEPTMLVFQQRPYPPRERITEVHFCIAIESPSETMMSDVLHRPVVITDSICVGLQVIDKDSKF